MPLKDAPNPAEQPTDARVAEPKNAAAKSETPLDARTHVFEHRHWVNEACGDDLWET